MSFKSQSQYVIISEFEKSSEKICAKQDKNNERMYAKLLQKASAAQKSIKNSGLCMNLEVPPPPKPSNRDRYILWKKRNIEKPVILQSEAVLFLNKKGYVLNKDYEAYQAIELYKEIKRNLGIVENNTDISKNFDNVFTKKDNNLLRRRSLYNLNNYEKYEEPKLSFIDEFKQFDNTIHESTNFSRNSKHRHTISYDPYRSINNVDCSVDRSNSFNEPLRPQERSNAPLDNYYLNLNKNLDNFENEVDVDTMDVKRIARNYEEKNLCNNTCLREGNCISRTKSFSTPKPSAPPKSRTESIEYC